MQLSLLETLSSSRPNKRSLEECVEVTTSPISGQQRLVSKNFVKKGELVFATPIVEVQEQPDRYSIQIGRFKHFQCFTSIKYMDHSFDPAVQIVAGDVEVLAIALRDLSPGDAITFNYNSTEFDMSCGFADVETGRQVRGYRYLSYEEKEEIRPIAAAYLLNEDMYWVYHKEYRTRGLTVVHGLISEGDCKQWVDWIESQLDEHGIVINGKAPYEDNPGAPYPPTDMDERGHYQYRYLESPIMEKNLTCQYWYTAMRNIATKITGEAIIESPYPKSRVLGIAYEKPGDCQAYHRDTQPVTVLVYLTNCEGGETVGTLFDGTTARVQPRAGSVLFMQGRHVRHESAPIISGKKIALPMNFYTTVDQWRPKTLDDDKYWVKSGAKDE